MDFDRQMEQWRDLEAAAIEAEQRLQGQLGNSPEAVEHFKDAAAKRKAADDFLAEMLRSAGGSA